MVWAAEASSVVAACLAAGEEAWLVGGAVRDGLLGAQSKDLDYAVRGDTCRLATAVADALGGRCFTYSETFSTQRVVLADGEIDFASLRGPSIEADLAARDFTVDALAVSARAENLGGLFETGRVIDPLGGLRHLRERRLVPCAPTAFSADPVRTLRLARLAAALDLDVAEQVLAASTRAAASLANVSGERIAQELAILLGGPAPVRGLRLLDRTGVLSAVLPEVAALRGVEQNPFHHLDVYEHTLEALERLPQVVAQMGGERFLAVPSQCGLPGAPPLAALAFAVLFHDLGKPVVKQTAQDGRILFLRHDDVGARMAVDIAARLHQSRRFQAYLTLLIRTHLRLGFLVREAPLTRRALLRYRRAVEPFVFESVVLSLADRLATRGARTSAAAIARHYRLARVVWLEIPKATRPRPLDGRQVMELLGLAPGPLVGEALRALQDEVDALEVRDREQAVRFLRRWWERRRSESGEDVERAGHA